MSEDRMVYRIRDWGPRYEVSKDGREARDRAKDFAELRKKPLDFVRWQVRGRDQGIGLRRLNTAAGADFAPAAFGVFAKLVEIAAQETCERRGYILTSDGDPMTVEDIAEATGWSEVVIEKALTVLTSERIKWVERVVFANLAEFSAPSRTEPNRTKLNITKPNRTARARETASASESANSISDFGSGEGGSEEAADGGGQEPGQEGIGAGNQHPTQPQPDPERRDALNRLWRRVKRATGDGPAWMDWWTVALPTIVDTQPLHDALLEALDYATDCADEATRERKGLGKLTRPGAYITGKVLDAVHGSGVTLPQLPTRAKGTSTPRGEAAHAA